MKAKIDTEAKTIELLEPIKMGDVIKEVKQLLPDSWKDYTIKYIDNDLYLPYYPCPPMPIYYNNGELTAQAVPAHFVTLNNY